MASRIHGLQDHCGSGLARDDIAAVYLTDRAACIAGKPAPTGYARPAEFTACRIIVGAGLPAMVSLRCTCQTVLSASQASQLPPAMGCAHPLGPHGGRQRLAFLRNLTNEQPNTKFTLSPFLHILLLSSAPLWGVAGRHASGGALVNILGNLPWPQHPSGFARPTSYLC